METKITELEKRVAELEKLVVAATTTEIVKHLVQENLNLIFDRMNKLYDQDCNYNNDSKSIECNPKDRVQVNWEHWKTTFYDSPDNQLISHDTSLKR